MRLKYFLAVYARKLTDSLNPKKFNCGGGHICAKVKTPYGQKRGGGIWRRPGGEPSGARAPPKGRAKRRAPPTAAALSPRAAERARKAQCPAARRFPTSLRTFTLYHFPRPAYTLSRRFLFTVFVRTAGRKKARPAGAPFLKGHHKFALWNDTIALRLKKTGRAAFRRRRAQIGWRSKKRLCYALFCPSAFFVKHSANFLKNAKGHHKFICANDNIALPGRKSRPCTAYSF